MSRKADAIEAARDRLRCEVPGAAIESRVGDATNEQNMRAALTFVTIWPVNSTLSYQL